MIVDIQTEGMTGAQIAATRMLRRSAEAEGAQRVDAEVNECGCYASMTLDHERVVWRVDEDGRLVVQ